RWQKFIAPRIRSSKQARDQSDAGRFHIAFAAGHLPRRAQPRGGSQAKLRIEKPWRVQEGIAMQPTEPRKLGALEPGNAAEDLLLRAIFELGLKSDHVVERAELVVLTKLHDRMGLGRWIVRISQSDRLHGTMAQRLAASLRHHLDRQAAVEIGRRTLPILELGFLARQQRADKRVVLRLAHWAVDVIGAGATRAGLVVTRLEPGDRHVDAVSVHYWRNRIEECQR